MQIIKVPGLNSFGKNNGCRNAGNAIIAELSKKKDISALEIEEIHVDNSNLEQQEKLIYDNSKEMFFIRDKIIFLGGDHSISYPIGRAFLDSFGNEDSYLIVFDAHADAMPPMREPSHEEWLRALIEKGFSPKRIFLIGLREVELEERRFLDEKKVNYYFINDIEDFEVFCDMLMERVNKENSRIYVSFDIDAIDPAFAPSTGYIVPGGFSSREIIYFAKRLSKIKKIKAVDIVEVNSEEDISKRNITVKLAANIVGEFL